jgi:hypothetical protein
VRAMFVCTVHTTFLSLYRENGWRYDKYTHVKLKLIVINDAHLFLIKEIRKGV